jgi:adenylate kinase family enzyme/inosine/xanthosine triphosphate pyrophosphatase family protein
MTNLEIIFITSSRIKLAHLQYLAREYPITIAKQKNYGIGYVEPRIYIREELLSESYKDALERFSKNVSNPDEKFFIIEDTSVIIDALSEDGEEVPGLDVKYWMKEHSFEMLDTMLKANKNNRKCSVRSDIILHLPKKMREKYGTDYMQFIGIVKGNIVSSEREYATNPSYPWLDNKTFNKWFAPEDDTPLGAMNVHKSEQYDFRKNAFDQIRLLLEEEGYIKENIAPQIKQYALPLYFDHLILVGPTCAGKSTLASHLAEKYGYFHLEASDFMHQKFYELHGVNTELTIGNFAQKALLENPCIVADLVAEHMNRLKDTPVIISGFRNPQEIQCFLKKYKCDINIIHINADIQIRYERNMNRQRKDDEIIFEKFEEKDQKQGEMGLYEMYSLYKESELLNEKGFEDFYNEFEARYGKILPEIEVIDETKILFDNKLKLEESILMAMYYDLKSEREYTTTELATLIRDKLNIEKNKNNVSRYFNQNFHPYFDAVKGTPVKYKLNSTGSSMARYLIKKLMG